MQETSRSRRRKVLIDIKHPAQLNLFKGLSRQLMQQNWEVTICYLDRGKLPKIIAREYQEFKTIPVGSSQGTKWSILWNGNIARTFTFMEMIRDNHYDICVAASSIPLALAARLSGVPMIQFYDDPERRLVNRINARLSSQLFFPPIVESNSRVSIFNCLKEWSYLSPRHFQPDTAVLKQYQVNAGEYLFAREVSNKSFNYFNQEEAIIAGFAAEIDPGIKVLLSLEDKSLKDRYPKHWQILEEPVSDIHSLMYLSKGVVSSGDSMAREGAMLGVPSIYCGVREMKANDLLSSIGLLRHFAGRSALMPLNQLAGTPGAGDSQESIRQNLAARWDDMNEFMMTQLYKYSKSN